MLPLLEEIYELGTVRDAGENPRSAFPATLPREDGLLLSRVATETDAKSVLEVGMAFGVSTLFLFDSPGADERRVTSIDPFQPSWFDNIGVLNVARAGFAERHECFEAPSHSAMPRLLDAGQQYDLIFLDGNHRFEHTLVDFHFAFRLAPVGGHILFHDVWLPSVRKVLTYILRSDIAVEPAPAFGSPAPSGLPPGLEQARAMLRSPREPLTALTLGRHAFGNVAVLQKTAEQDETAFAQAWDHYPGC